jgi:hypothetical protein
LIQPSPLLSLASMARVIAGRPFLSQRNGAGQSITKEFLETLRRQRGIAGGVLDIDVPELGPPHYAGKERKDAQGIESVPIPTAAKTFWVGAPAGVGDYRLVRLGRLSDGECRFVVVLID